jgi:acetylornithine deacetylase/succinyl-diaminopimelate desuccinylase-like protein
MSTFEAFVAAQHDRMVEDLKAFVAQPSVAATNLGMGEMAALVQQRLERIGATVQQIPTGGAPIVYAELGSGPRTLLIYNHYDVQPPDPIDLWTTPPFEPSVRDGHLFASRRGSKRSGRCR